MSACHEAPAGGGTDGRDIVVGQHHALVRQPVQVRRLDLGAMETNVVPTLNNI